VQIANINSPTQIILGGSTADLSRLEAALKAEGMIARLLPVSAAFHTPYVAHAQQPFAKAIEALPFQSPQGTVYSNTTAQAYPADAAQMRGTLINHILNPVRFKDEVEQMYTDGGRIFVEFGPRNILTKLVGEILKGRPHQAIALNANAKKDSDRQFREGVIQLAVLGIPVQGFDRFVQDYQAPRAKGKLNVRISGYNYVSAGTQKKHQEALQKNTPQWAGAAVNASNHPNQETEMTAEERALLNNIQTEVNRLTQQQNRIEELLQNLVQQNNQRTVAPAMPSPDQKIAQPVATAPPSNGHTVKAPTSPAVATVSTPLPTQTSGISTAEISNSLLEVIAEKTGYPSEMLELGMDMEADLGIDSIKRVEIFGAMTEANPSVQGVNPQELAELRTLQQIVDYIAAKAGASSTTTVEAPSNTAAAVATPKVTTSTPAPSVPNTSSGISTAEISDSLLEVIAEKTGYPAEMLELGMDMEADLGIDSIKRVEIFGAMTEANPSVQGVNPQELAELRTLQQIVDYIAAKAGASSTTTVETPSNTAAAVVLTPQATTSAPAPSVPNTNSGISTAEISDSLLEVIAEKTGYPAEMLELGMDMEADLGIDSIKRVEIFGAMTEANPSVQGVNPQELAELRTLQQIVDYIAAKAGASSTPATPAAKLTSTETIVAPKVTTPIAAPIAQSANKGISTTEISNSLLEVIAEKTGYPAEMLELGMDMEADLGIDSIKRVEIFGAMTEANPSVQGVNPQELAELRTLQQIVDYIANKAGANTSAAVVNGSSSNGHNSNGNGVHKNGTSKDAAAIAAQNGNTSSISTAEIADSLLEVIAEKTGYPAEMLELGMDMEADLGIDSIKRVEIFGAMTEANPSVQGVNPQELAELRTLQQIVDYIAAKAGAEKKKPGPIIETVTTDTLGMSHFPSGSYPRVPRLTVELKPIPRPDQLLVKRQASEVTLVTNEGSALTMALCKQLQASGHEVVLLSLPEQLVRKNSHPVPAGVREVHLQETSDQGIQQCLQALTANVTSLIYLHPHFRFPLGQFGRHFEQEKALTKTVFLLAKHLKSSLNNQAAKRRTAFMCVTRLDGARGMNNPGNVSVIGAGLFGLCKSLNLEWPKVFCRAVDVSPMLQSDLAAQKIIQELLDADRCLTETVYDEQEQRYTVATQEQVPPRQKQLQSTINEKSVFLVTGGARGVTADCVRTLAKQFKSSFILVGRSQLAGAEPNWALGITDANTLKRKAMESRIASGEKPHPKTIQRMVGKVLAQREIQANLDYIRSQGAKVYYEAADVTNPSALKAAIDKVTAETGPVTGIIHGAGRLADKLIENKTEADFDAVYDVKINGLLAAVQSIQLEAIEQVVLFSSVAGFYGNVGQTDYAIANEILNHVAHLFKTNHPNVHVVSINWGAWDAGMVSPQLKKIFEAHGVALVPSEEGPLAMLDQLSTSHAHQTQVILGGTLPLAKAATDGELTTHVMTRHLTEDANPFLGHHMIQGNAVLPIINASTWMAQAARDFYPGFYLQKVEKAKLFKGIVFDGKQQDHYQLILKELEKDEEQIKVQVTISSDTGAKLPLNHYQSTIYLVAERPKAPIVPLPNIQQITPVMADASAVYEDGTLFHGSDFRGVKQVLELHEKGILLLCEHPGVDPIRQGQFPVKDLNPFLTDIMYQGLLIWVRKFHGCASLPLRTEWVEIFEALPFGRPFYVALEVLKSDDFSMEADITAYDAISGKMYLKSHRAGVTISRDLQWA
ncbi:MAG: SDR family NAD(P)-dependent oxidoreductase, partial [Bacteroidota bacterium]